MYKSRAETGNAWRWVAPVVVTAAVAGACALYVYYHPLAAPFLRASAQKLAHAALFAALAWAAWFAGHLLIRLVFRREESWWELELAVGLAAFGFAAFALAALGLLYPWVVRGVVLAVVALSAPTLWRTLRGARERLEARRDALSPGVLLLGAAALPFLAAVLVRATQPPTDWDVLVYHLYIPKVYAAAHGIVYLPRLVFASMPLNGEMMFLWAYQWDGLGAAAAVAPLVNVLTLVVTWRLARLWLDNFWAAMAAAVLLFTPVFAGSLPIADVDFIVATFVLLAFHLYVRGFARGRDAALAGLLLGLALGTKYTGAHAALAFVPLVALDLARRRLTLGRAAVFFGVALAVYAPWMVKAWAERGDPFFPALYGVFGGRDLSPEVAAAAMRWLRGMGMGRGLWDYVALPYRLSFLASNGYDKFDGFLLPFSIVALALACVWFRRWRLLLFAAAYVASWAFIGSQQLRFLSAAVALCAVAAAGVLAAAAAAFRKGGQTAFRVAAAAFVFLFGYWLNFPLAWGGVRALDYYAYGDADKFLLGATPCYAPTKFVNEELPRDAVVLMLFDSHLLYLERRAVYDSFWEASETLHHVQKLPDAAAVDAYVRSLGVTHLLICTQEPERYWHYYDAATKDHWEGYLDLYTTVIARPYGYEIRAVNPGP